MSRIKTPADIEIMRAGGHMLATVLSLLKSQAEPGVTPKDLAMVAARELKALGGEPVFLGYKGFPDVICISVNDQVQHSIPTDTPLEEGDVVNFDFGVRYKGLVTDGGITVGIGNISREDQRLLKGTEEALNKAIDSLKDGIKVGDISARIEEILRGYDLGIVRELVGHGVGDVLHEEPEIPNYGHRGTGPVLKAGMTVAIEPIANLGGEQIVLERDGWTLKTADGSNSAQFEHTVLITAAGAEILTI